MSEVFYERLSPLDATFLLSQDENAHMHVGSVSTFDAKSLTLPGGGLDFERIERAMFVMLDRNPRMRQRVWWPTGGPPVWIDDVDFRLSYHLRKTALPLPGTDRQLKRLAGRVMSQTLDLAKPLWEIWVVEGLERDRFALLAKLHHCLADGIGARDILTGYLNLEPRQPPEVVDRWRPRPAPSLMQIQRDGVQRRFEKSAELLRDLGRYVVGQSPGESMLHTAMGALSAASNLVGEITPTPLNRKIGPHRRFDWIASPFERVRMIRKTLGGKVNDVVLACVTGAMRRFLLQRRLHVDELDFRIMVPVNVRTENQDGTAGNRVSSMTVPIPLFETDPIRRLKRVISTTSRIKASSQSDAANLFTQLMDAAGIYPPRAFALRAAQRMTANLVVTNVPGPQFPMYLTDALMLESFPLVPLSHQQGLGIALYTYDKALHWGFNGDWDLVPDLHDIALAVESEFAALVDACTPVTITSPPVDHAAQARELDAEAASVESLSAESSSVESSSPESSSPESASAEASSASSGDTAESTTRAGAMDAAVESAALETDVSVATDAAKEMTAAREASASEVSGAAKPVAEPSSVRKPRKRSRQRAKAPVPSAEQN